MVFGKSTAFVAAFALLQLSMCARDQHQSKKTTDDRARETGYASGSSVGAQLSQDMEAALTSSGYSKAQAQELATQAYGNMMAGASNGTSLKLDSPVHSTGNTMNDIYEAAPTAVAGLNFSRAGLTASDAAKVYQVVGASIIASVARIGASSDPDKVDITTNVATNIASALLALVPSDLLPAALAGVTQGILQHIDKLGLQDPTSASQAATAGVLAALSKPAVDGKATDPIATMGAIATSVIGAAGTDATAASNNITGFTAGMTSALNASPALQTIGGDIVGGVGTALAATLESSSFSPDDLQMVAKASSKSLVDASSASSNMSGNTPALLTKFATSFVKNLAPSSAPLIAASIMAGAVTASIGIRSDSSIDDVVGAAMKGVSSGAASVKGADSTVYQAIVIQASAAAMANATLESAQAIVQATTDNSLEGATHLQLTSADVANIASSASSAILQQASKQTALNSAMGSITSSAVQHATAAALTKGLTTNDLKSMHVKMSSDAAGVLQTMPSSVANAGITGLTKGLITSLPSNMSQSDISDSASGIMKSLTVKLKTVSAPTLATFIASATTGVGTGVQSISGLQMSSASSIINGAANAAIAAAPAAAQNAVKSSANSAVSAANTAASANTSQQNKSTIPEIACSALAKLATRTTLITPIYVHIMAGAVGTSMPLCTVDGNALLTCSTYQGSMVNTLPKPKNIDVQAVVGSKTQCRLVRSK